MANKSFSTENEIGNVICDWKIDNKIFEVMSCPSFLIFTWPLTKCQFKLVVGRTDGNRYFISVKNLDESFPFKLSGTISIITAEKTVHVLGQFEERTVEIDKWIDVNLRNLRGLKCGKDILFPNNTLTLRIQLWKPEVKNEVTVKHYAYSRLNEQKCFFQWIVKSETDDSGNEWFTRYVTEVPGSFQYYSNGKHFQMSVTLEFEEFYF